MLHLMYRTISVPYSTLSIIVSFRKTFHAGQAHSNVLSLFCICINDNSNAVACCIIVLDRTLHFASLRFAHMNYSAQSGMH